MQGCLMKLQGVMQSYINVIGAIIIAVWAVVVNMLMLMLMVYFCLQVREASPLQNR